MGWECLSLSKSFTVTRSATCDDYFSRSDVIYATSGFHGISASLSKWTRIHAGPENNFFAFTGGLFTKNLRRSVVAPNCLRYPRAKSNIRSALEHIIEAVSANTYGGSWLSTFKILHNS
ncbi:hypothetical protein EYC80_008842 [Monilinia laxa]|uniref:Uncharacterized protein n=1 Tax=Monilinia laxa TaxID=61186 RepID=A0A5N6K1K3_MONLA|nr:hypothetical protein EYC80_008842 [Monilinia laxa]